MVKETLPKERLVFVSPSHTKPQNKGKALVHEAEKLKRLQWSEGAPARTEEGEKKKAQAHETRLVREADLKRAEVKTAYLEEQKAIALAGNRKAPLLTIADVAGL